jgi:CBS domain containing-hemolysin-like protein
MLDFLYGSILISSLLSLSFLFSFDLETKSQASSFELKRRARGGDKLAKRQAWAARHSGDLNFVANLALLINILLVMYLLMLKLKPWWLSLIVIVVVAILARFIKLKYGGSKLFRSVNFRMMGWLQMLAKTLGALVPILFKASKQKQEAERAFYSEEEFRRALEQDGDVLSEELRLVVRRAVNGGTVSVKDVMAGIETLPKMEARSLLTPVICDEMYKNGYSMAAVFEEREDNFVGILNLKSLGINGLGSNRGSVSVAEVMDRSIAYAAYDTKLDELVKDMLHNGNSACMVGSNGRVMGIITVQALLGWFRGLSLEDRQEVAKEG